MSKRAERRAGADTAAATDAAAAMVGAAVRSGPGPASGRPTRQRHGHRGRSAPGALAVPVPVEPASSTPLWFGVSLLIALAATLPAFTGVVDGSTTLVTAAARFLVVAACAWAVSQVLVLVLPRRQPISSRDSAAAEPAPVDR